MTTVLIVLMILIMVLIVLMAVYKHGKKSGNLVEKEQQRIIAETSDTIKRFATQKQQEAELQKEVLSDAEQKKAELSGGATGMDRFNLINDSLRRNSRAGNSDTNTN
jgi:LAS superfamily LD-carboxypeptidase LdcB